MHLTEKAVGEEFSERDEEAVQVLAGFAGVAIDHARPYTRLKSCHSELRRAMDPLDATMWIARAVGGETGLGLTLGPVAKRGRAVVSARALAIEHQRGLDRDIGMSTQTAETVPPTLRVIEPKLMLPRVHPGMLRRARLHEMLDRDPGAALTMVDAAVGYGKTTLLRSWCIERPEAVIWMTLDAADDDPVRLWTHLATAVERLGEGLGGRALMCLGVRGATVETAVDELMNGLVAYGQPITIVLDDLHAVGSERSLRSIAHAIERLPANARVLASTRSDPAISLARLRARGALVEIRARELAFTVDEARELIVREGIELSEESVELLVERTEGWPAGLYLAALWLRDVEDPDQGVRSFAGSARHVADYLTDEVLTALPPQTRDFLLRTSVLGRFTPDLCDAVLGREDSAAVLAELARSNMFLVALDANGEWYRYHHLFGELLQLELGGEDAPVLRRRAAAWCRAHGLVEDAIEYAAAAGDAETVAELLVEHHLEFVWGGRVGQFLGWVRWLPPSCCLSTLLCRYSERLPLRCWRARRSRFSGCLRWRSGRGGSGRSCGRRTSRRSRRSPVPRRSSGATSARPSSTLAARSRPLARARTS